ncbi:MAG: hypothetical protein SNJ63_07560 [Sphingomonadaceae bacterium]
MKALSSAPHRLLMAAIRQAILADSWFSGWLAGSDVGPSLVIEDFHSEPWASLTFAGARHAITLRLSGPAEQVERAWDRLEALFTAPDLPLAGHFLADFEIGERMGEILENGDMVLRISLEALTIAE